MWGEGLLVRGKVVVKKSSHEGCVAGVGIEGVGTSFQRINGGIGGDLSDEGGG